MGDDWVGLSEAADILGVHPSTVRTWADNGELPVTRTAGGHRRFSRAALEAWNANHHSGGEREAQLVMQNVIGRIRLEVPRLQEQAWYMKLDEAQREAYREESRRLMEQFESVERADELGAEYARISLDADMSMLEAVEAFLFFRGVFMESLFGLQELGSTSGWSQIHRDASRFTDLVLLSLLENYQTV